MKEPWHIEESFQYTLSSLPTESLFIVGWWSWDFGRTVTVIECTRAANLDWKKYLSTSQLNPMIWHSLAHSYHGAAHDVYPTKIETMSHKSNTVPFPWSIDWQGSIRSAHTDYSVPSSAVWLSRSWVVPEQIKCHSRDTFHMNDKCLSLLPKQRSS